MKLFFCLITSICISYSVNSQNSSQSATQLNSLVKEYDELFVYTKSVVDVLKVPVVKNNQLLNKIIYDANISGENSIDITTNALENDSTLDFGLKWVSDATYNFSPGIGENEDVFFRSRISTGVDWVILGEGSIQRKKEGRRIFNQQVLRDSMQFKLNSNSLLLHKKQLFLQHIFDLHRLDILKKYQQILQMHASYQDQMYQAKLNTEVAKINANSKLQTVTDMVDVYEMYLSKNIPNDLVEEYWSVPYIDAALPDLSSISLDNLLKEEELLVQMQKELLSSKQKPSEKPSLRAKFRYNYYDNAEQVGRSFASVGASFSVPIRFGKDNKSIAYEMATYDNNLYYEKLKLKDKLSVQHKSFNLLKNKLFQLQNDISYLEAVLKNETDVYQQQNKNFSPAKYIENAEMLIQKKLAVLDIKQQLCEAYVAFQTLNGLNETSTFNQSLKNHSYKVAGTYMWESTFIAVANDSLINQLNKKGIDTLLLSPGSNTAKITDFLHKAQSKNIHVSRLISENSYVNDVNGTQKLSTKLKTLEQFAYSGIHLNVEPHTFSDYKNNIPWYTQRMDSIYATAKQWSDSRNISLSVSIPMHLPIQNATYLANNNIKAYIMAYESNDQEKLLQRTQLLRKTLHNNYVWVLRVSDFSDQTQLLDAVNYLQANDISVAIYDFSTFTNMF